MMASCSSLQLSKLLNSWFEGSCFRKYQAQLPQLQRTSNDLLPAASIPSLCPHCGK